MARVIKICPYCGFESSDAMTSIEAQRRLTNHILYRCRRSPQNQARIAKKKNPDKPVELKDLI